MAVPATITYDRYQAVDFSEYLGVEYHAAMYPFPTLQADPLGLIKPLSKKVIIPI